MNATFFVPFLGGYLDVDDMAQWKGSNKYTLKIGRSDKLKKSKIAVSAILVDLVTFHPLCVLSGGYYNHVGTLKCDCIFELA